MAPQVNEADVKTDADRDENRDPSDVVAETAAESKAWRVVVNHEEQYSILPADRVIPGGWRDVGVSGSREQCLAHIREVWTDMRPLSLRLAMDRATSGAPGSSPTEASAPASDPRDDLVGFLEQGMHPVRWVAPSCGSGGLKKELVRGFVHVRFTDTRGGTDLALTVDTSCSDWKCLEHEPPTGVVHVEGLLTLDFVPVRCVVDLQVPEMQGSGRLVRTARSSPDHWSDV